MEWTADELLANNQNILITGAPGYGKTSFSRNHFLADLEKFRTGQSKVVPLYFAAHTVEISDRQTFEDVFVRREVADRLASDQSLSARIYLDGLDEVRSKEGRDRILAIVRNAVSLMEVDIIVLPRHANTWAVIGLAGLRGSGSI